MGVTGVIVLVACVVAIFAAIIFWAVAIQPRGERARAQLSPDEAWKLSGFDMQRAEGFALLQIVPTDQLRKAEFVIQDEWRREVGRYTSTINKSGTLAYGGKTAGLFIQGGVVGGSRYAGKVGGTSNDSIVIRDDAHVIAEVWRENAMPPIRYRFVAGGETFSITTGGLSPTSAGTIVLGEEQVGAFRRGSGTLRNVFVALRPELSEELKVCLCSIILLE
jgi:hypothetical protein